MRISGRTESAQRIVCPSDNSSFNIKLRARSSGPEHKLCFINGRAFREILKDKMLFIKWPFRNLQKITTSRLDVWVWNWTLGLPVYSKPFTVYTLPRKYSAFVIRFSVLDFSLIYSNQIRESLAVLKSWKLIFLCQAAFKIGSTRNPLNLGFLIWLNDMIAF